MAIVVRKYGLLPPSDWGGDAFDCLRRQARLWNSLVELHNKNREEYNRILSATDDTVARLTQQIATLQSTLEAAMAGKKRKRAAARSKRVEAGEEERTIKQALAEIRALRPQLRAAKQLAKVEAAPAIKAMSQRFYEAVKAAGHASGLWWGNYEAVQNSFEVARARALKEGAQLRFRSFTGEGRFSARESGGVTPAAVFAGQCAWLKIAPVPPAAYDLGTFRGERRRLCRTTLTVRIYTGKDPNGKRISRTLTWPLVMHRPLPEGAIIKNITVNRRRIGPDFKWECALLCETPDAPVETRPGVKVCGIDLGFRLVKDGLRIAYLASEEEDREIVLPVEWLEQMEFVETLSTRMDDATNAATASVAATVKAGPESLREAARAPRWSSRTLSRVLRVWHEQHADYAPDKLQELAKWHSGHTRVWRQRENMRSRLLLNRKDRYQNLAREIVAGYGVVAIEDLNLSKLATRERQTKDSIIDNKLSQAARKQRTWAALSVFVQALRSQAEKAGTQVVRVPAAFTTTTCSACGKNMVLTEAGRLEVHVICNACGSMIDQDKNAALNLRDAAKHPHLLAREGRIIDDNQPTA